MLRHRYETSPSTFVRLNGLLPTGIQVRQPTERDQGALAELMMGAYVGTIDYDGETVEDAENEVARWFANEAYLSTSLVALDGDCIVSGVLNSLSDGDPLIGYVMTRARWKGRGIARALLETAVLSILADGHDRVSGWITDGNVPSERLFARAGFAVVDTFETGAT